MRKISLSILVFFASLQVLADIDMSYTRSGSEDYYDNTISLGYSLDSFVNEDTGVAGLSQYISYSFFDSETTLNINKNLANFKIPFQAHELNYTLTLYESLSLLMGGSMGRYTEGEALSKQYYYGLEYEFSGVKLGMSIAKNKIYENQDVLVLSKNVRDDIQFTQTSATYLLSYEWSESFLTKVTGTYYSYDKNLNDLFNVLSTVVLLRRAGGSVAYEVQSQPSASVDLTLNYAINDSWMVHLGGTATRDELPPQDVTNSASLGFDYTSNSDSGYSYNIGSTVSSSRIESGTDNSLYAMLSLGLSF